LRVKLGKSAGNNENLNTSFYFIEPIVTIFVTFESIQISGPAKYN